MLSRDQIKKLFFILNDRLKEQGEVGEIGIVGGAVMCLVFNARMATRDVDAIFKPTKIIRKIAKEIGQEEGIGSEWLNDAAKGFIQGSFQRAEVIQLSNLRVWSPHAEYMLAMKCISARWDIYDRDDVAFFDSALETKKNQRGVSID